MKEKTPTFSTADLMVAAYLKVKGLRLLKIDRGNNGRGLFIFEDQPERKKLILAFLNHEALVEPISYIETQRSLKGAVREA